MTDVVLSHHHPDHTLNAALFPVVPVHDYQWIVEADHLTSRDADGVQLTASVRLLVTPGHSREDITVLVGTADDVVALTHLWWSAGGPADDPFSPDRQQTAGAAGESPRARHADRPRARRTVPSGSVDGAVTPSAEFTLSR